jgi:hypothetical protein
MVEGWIQKRGRENQWKISVSGLDWVTMVSKLLLAYQSKLGLQWGSRKSLQKPGLPEFATSSIFDHIV